MIPVWDGYAEERLVRAVHSVLGQSRPVEVVVVDNASEVELPHLDGVRVVRTPQRLRLGAARNFGIELAQTPYIACWDADDTMLDGAVAFMEDRLDSDPGLVAFGMAIVEAQSGLRHRWPRRWLGPLTRRPGLLATMNCVWSVFPTTGATLMRTDAVRKAGGYADADSGEDWCLGASLVFRGRVGWSERAGRTYSTRPESVWATHSGPRHQFAHAAVVRRRLATDPAVPRWLSGPLPLLAVLQTAAVGAHLLLARLRLRRR